MIRVVMIITMALITMMITMIEITMMRSYIIYYNTFIFILTLLPSFLIIFLIII